MVCDVGEVLFADLRCICAEGLLQSANGCVPCGGPRSAQGSGTFTPIPAAAALLARAVPFEFALPGATATRMSV